MRRRDALVGLGTVPALLTASHRLAGQEAPKRFRLGIVSGNPRTTRFWVGFDQRLRELGHSEGQNLVVDFIDTRGRPETFSEGAHELVRRNVDAIVASGPEASLKSALAATHETPIVMVAVDYDPLALGYVNSLARPTGNVTGLFFQQIELAVKRVELLKQALPTLQAATVFWDHLSGDQWQALQDRQAELRIRLNGVEFTVQPYDYDRGIERAPLDGRALLIVLTSPIFFRDRQRLANFALLHNMISTFAFREWAEAGGLLSYGPSIDAMFRRAAEYVDRIARGTKVSDLPIEQPTKFELVLNLNTAKALNLTIPPTLLARADEVIE